MGMFEWTIFFVDAHGRNSSRKHAGKEAATAQALDLERRQTCRVEKLEGPNGEVIDRTQFERLLAEKR
jgi:hypothetical protein